MKKMILSTILVLVCVYANAQTPDAILGKWQSSNGNERIQIEKSGNYYSGKLIWLQQPRDETGKDKTDRNNPSKDLRSKPLIGVELLKSFTYKGDSVWGNGKVYDPKTGNTYNGLMSMPNSAQLNIRTYFGINILGHTEAWTRIP